MKKPFILFLFSIILSIPIHAQNSNCIANPAVESQTDNSILNSQQCYWVFLTDKAGTTFDPYTYFDAKAIERYRLNNADLYDISNYPLNDSYVCQVTALATEEVGQSRWFNATAVMATPDQIVRIQQLPFVKEVIAIESNMHLTNSHPNDSFELNQESEANLHDQLVRMGGKYFREKGIDGKGVRIAIFDGGFPQVNTHAAFQHVRDNNQIVKTWNFPNKKENVYGWNSHGLMTFSCIAGRCGDMDLGLATGSEFLLARTEVATEPFKEEVWWQMAVEWADKNGAQIISSSLGYGKDRYYTKDMNGQSYVAKAGNMAARKGILVCNSAGNEGDDNSWYTIITPSDADSVLCVGGINPSLTDYDRTSFSSYGPSADGRQKPNVCAFAYAWTANTGKSQNEYHMVPGTSFSCPLVSGFAACALQTHPKLTAMQLFHEIEKSADLYPYCDYTFGYGVPQADYFTGDRKKVEPTFKFIESNGNIRLVPLKKIENVRVFVKNSTSNGTITDYAQYELSGCDTNNYIEFTEGDIITVNFDGYTESYSLNKHPNTQSCENQESANSRINWITDTNMYCSTETVGHFSTRLNEKRGLWEYFFMYGLAVKTDDSELENRVWSPDVHVGMRYLYHFTKAYSWGFSLDYSNCRFRFGEEANRLDSLAAMDDDIAWFDKKIKQHSVNLGELSVELFQRIRFVPGGISHKGWHWDLGVYGSIGYDIYTLKGSRNGDIANSREIRLSFIDPLDDYRWNWGVTTRISRDWIGIYARYRLNNIGKDVDADKALLPRLVAGIQLSF